MAGIPDQKPFLYGTHYSAPGYVLYYLVRQGTALFLPLSSFPFDPSSSSPSLKSPSSLPSLLPSSALNLPHPPHSIFFWAVLFSHSFGYCSKQRLLLILSSSCCSPSFSNSPSSPLLSLSFVFTDSM